MFVKKGQNKIYYIHTKKDIDIARRPTCAYFVYQLLFETFQDA